MITLNALRRRTLLLLTAICAGVFSGCHEEETRTVQCSSALDIASATGSVRVTISVSHDGDESYNTEVARAAAYSQCLASNAANITRCYDGNGLEISDYPARLRSQCPSNRTWKDSYVFRMGDGLGIAVNSSAQEAWVASTSRGGLATSSGSGEAVAELICRDTATSATFVLYRARSTTNTHYYYGKAQRPGLCTADKVLEKRYRANATHGTPAGVKPGHKDIGSLTIPVERLLEYVKSYLRKQGGPSISQVGAVVVLANKIWTTLSIQGCRKRSYRMS